MVVAHELIPQEYGGRGGIPPNARTGISLDDPYDEQPFSVTFDSDGDIGGFIADAEEVLSIGGIEIRELKLSRIKSAAAGIGSIASSSPRLYSPELRT